MIKKLSYIIFVLSIFSSLSGFSQLRWKYSKKKDTPAKNSVYFEYMGAAVQWSLNYERDLGPLLFRVGGGIIDEDIMAPIMLSYVYVHKRVLSVETGAGVISKFQQSVPIGLPASSVRPSYEAFPALNFAARYQPSKRGYFVKIAFNPILDLPHGNNDYRFLGQNPPIPIFFWGGASFGIKF